MSSKSKPTGDPKANRKPLPSSSSSSTSRSRPPASKKDDDAWLDAELAKLSSTTTTPLTSKPTKTPLPSRSKRDSPSDREPSQPPPPSAAPPRPKHRPESLDATTKVTKTVPPKEVRAHRSSSSSARPSSSRTRPQSVKKKYATEPSDGVPDNDGLAYDEQDVYQPPSVLPDSIEIPGVSVSLEELVVEEEAATAREKAKKEMIQQEEPALDLPDEYDEDFEEYEEDFEDFEDETDGNDQEQKEEQRIANRSPTYHEKRRKEVETELDDIKKAMNDENERTERQRTESANARDRKVKEEKSRQDERLSDVEHEAIRARLPERNKVDIEQLSKKKQSAKRKMVMNTKTERRVKDLAGLIDLDVASYNLLDLPPMSEYELYIRNFGTSNTQQTYTQSNEDQVDRDTQTDDWLVEDKWSQMPSDGMMECGSGVPGIEASQDTTSSMAEQIKEMKNVIKKHNRQGGKEDSARLAKFLRNASQTCEILLDENLSDGGSSHWFSMSSSFSFSQGYRTLSWDHIIQEGRHVTSICFSPSDSRLMLTVWSLPGKNRVVGVWGHAARAWDHMGVVCLWRNDCSRPSRLLVCEGEITCCKFNPTRPHIIYGGTADGGVVVWDLREITVTTLSGTNYSIIPDKGDQTIHVQKPAYNTQALYIQKEGHVAPIRKLLPLPPKLNAGSNKNVQDGETVSLAPSTGAAPSQLATVDASGVLHTWVLIELAEADLAGSEVDVGLAIGSVVKLIKSASMHFKNPKRGGIVPDVTVLDCITQPDDPSRFFAAVDVGCVLRASRFGDKTVPSAYYPNSHSTPSASAGVPTTLNISHMVPTESTPLASPNYLLLTGYDTGVYTIHSMDDPVPILSFSATPTQNLESASSLERPTSTAPVLWARFSPHRPAVFYILDAEDTLLIWDLLESDSAPVHISSLAIPPEGKLTAIGISGDLEDSGSLTEIPLGKTNSGNTKNGYIAFAYSTGNIQVHLLSEELCEHAIDENVQFRDMMESTWR